MANLLANALRHTPAGTPVELGVGARGGWALWQVIDHGPGIPPADAEKVFERFWRADTSRARTTGGGAGLGMAIVAAIVQSHHGAVRVVETPGGGATIEVALPLLEAATDDDVPEVHDVDGDPPEGSDDRSPLPEPSRSS
jgi:two-component system OmpR family sensor kinase